MSLRRLINLVVVLAITSSAAFGSPISVGSGSNTAGLYIEWSDGYIAEFLVSFEEPNVTGLELFDIIESETGLSTVRNDFGFGVFIDGITYDGHSDAGWGGGDNWWHYWTRDFNEGLWVFSWIGACDRIVGNGDCDGWTYSHSYEPAYGPTLEMLAAINIKMAIASKIEAQQAIAAAMAKELEATKALNALLSSGEAADLKSADIHKAKGKIHSATTSEKVGKRALNKSVIALEDALAILAGEGE